MTPSSPIRLPTADEEFSYRLQLFSFDTQKFTREALQNLSTRGAKDDTKFTVFDSETSLATIRFFIPILFIIN